jgi:hypothetical protein
MVFPNPSPNLKTRTMPTRAPRTIFVRLARMSNPRSYPNRNGRQRSAVGT